MSSNGKETRPKETPNREPVFEQEYKFNFRDRLQLPTALKKAITSLNMDWRFLNQSELRKSGGENHNYWRAFNISMLKGEKETFGATAEGTIQRGDLVLGVRPKAATKAHKAFLAEQNARLSGKSVQKADAEKLREHAKNIGLSRDQAVVHEGFEDDRKTSRGTYSEVDS